MELIQRGRAGDTEAFAAFFHQYKNLVYKTAFLLLGSAEEAEDALQEVFLAVHRSLDAFDPAKGAITTWLHRVPVNHCLNRRRSRRFFALSLDEGLAAAPAAHGEAGDERLEDEEGVQQALGRLSGKLRAPVVLRYYLELSYAEMAEVLNVPLGTVKSRLDLALKTLRKELAAAEAAAAPGVLPQREVAR